jgi:nitroimidazol reductase NimA-like FMN-containing flavoprotein (pyridoxamine 5'-phosphate oxidase superfamily)
MSMSPPGREEFLAEVRVGVLAVAGEDGAGPLAVPIWYAYEPGGAVSLTTSPGSRKARAIAASGRYSLL